ncbi:MAG: hypothetical protein JWQ94_3106 [Tardiphaga sp.]|jgi:hypothetical protein|nr:hypothetical protein [Tardiphaga sp.]
MSEAEFDLLLNAVRTEIEAEALDDLRSQAMFLAPVPAAANDNSMEWPMVPFPDGWEASC